MSLSGSISGWIKGAKAGCEQAATQLWARYRTMLLNLARKKLGTSARNVSDEEDIVLDTFQFFFRRCREGAYPNVRDRDDLGKLLVAITVHKATNQVRDELRRKRAGGGVSALSEPMVLNDFHYFDLLPGAEPSPEFVSMMEDSLKKFLSLFVDGELRSIVLYKIEGYTNEQVAEKIGRSVPTVERRLRLIRETWLEQMDS